MNKMSWKRLLSDRRFVPERDSSPAGLRSAFSKDRHQIVESAAFRRLADKTQVFPLDKSDFIRTRLTHSLEVASIGRSLAENVGESLIREKKDPEFGEKEKTALGEVLECAGLCHDIGNPPFGHFGEEVIRAWFKRHMTGIDHLLSELSMTLDTRHKKDLLLFDGNAQGFRLVTRLSSSGEEAGMNLTAAVLSAMLKYPTSSEDADDKNADASRKKAGYMASEQDVFNWVETETGALGRRTPMAFLLETADDIAYATADLEDAFKKGFLSYPILLEELSERNVPKRIIQRLKDHYDFSRIHADVNPEETAVRKWLTSIQGDLLAGATRNFLSSYDAIMAGRMKTDLLGNSAAGKLLNHLKSIAYDRAFTTTSIYRSEIAGSAVLNFLLDHMIPAAIRYDTNLPAELLDEKYLSLVSENFRSVYHRRAKNASAEEKAYLRILMALDSISGMTDSYARDLFQELA